MKYRIVFQPKARDDLANIFLYILDQAGETIARNYVRKIRAYCEGFETFPKRGQVHDDLSPGLRLVGFQRQATIAFTVEGDVVQILRIFYGGQNIALDDEE